MIAIAQPDRLPALDPHQDPPRHDPGVSPFPLAPETLDLRRALHREHAELIIARAECLPAQDRALVQSVYEEGMTVARLAGLRNECPRALRRRLRRIIARVLSPRFAFVMHSQDTWPATWRKVATGVVLHGHSMRRAAKALKCSLHTVRKEMQKVDALFETGGHR